MSSKLEAMTDEELVVSYAMGLNKAFDHLLSRHQSSIYNYIFFIVKNKELTEDIFQETFIKAVSTIRQGRYTENGKFRAWISRIAYNLVIDHFRKEKNINSVSSQNEQIDLFNNASLCEATIEDRLIKAQIEFDVKSLIQRLPKHQREVLEMRFYKDLSFKEISNATGVSINTALGRMRYAIINIRKMAEDNNIALTIQ